MPVLLPEDLNVELPNMIDVKQIFDKEYIEDIGFAIETELGRKEITSLIIFQKPKVK